MKIDELQTDLIEEFNALWEKQGKNEFSNNRGRYVFVNQGSQLLSDYIRIRTKEILKKDIL
jgi:hypothetical protein